MTIFEYCECTDYLKYHMYAGTIYHNVIQQIPRIYMYMYTCTGVHCSHELLQSPPDLFPV